MKYPPRLLFLLLVLLTVSIADAQTITKVQDRYVLIDTNLNIGDLQQKLYVYRIDAGQLITVGRVQIVEFRSGKTAAVILHENRGFKITAGDFVSKREIDALDLADIYPAEKAKAQKPPAEGDQKPQTLPPAAANQQTVSKPQDRAALDDRSQRAPAGRAAVRKNLLHVGVYGGLHVPATLQTTYKTSPSLGAAVRFFARSRNSLMLDFTLNLLRPEDAAGSIENLSSLMFNFRLGAGFFIKYDLGLGLVFDKGASFAADLGFALDLPIFSLLILSPGLRLTLYRAAGNWEGFVTGGVTVFFGLL